MPLSLSQLERHLLAAADGLRGPLSPHEYQDYLLPLLFLKHASDEFDAARTRLLAAATAQGSSAQQAAAIADSPDAHEQAGSLYVPPAARWKRIAAATDDIAKSCLSPALATMAAAHPSCGTPSPASTSHGSVAVMPRTPTAGSARSSTTSRLFPCTRRLSPTRT